MEEYDMYHDFDINRHKEKYIYYFEALIKPDGEVVYAVPSHQEKAIELACSTLNVDRKQLGDMCPEEYYFDFMTWLLMQTGCIAVWYRDFLAPEITYEQKRKLMILKSAGVYDGPIPVIKNK